MRRRHTVVLGVQADVRRKRAKITTNVVEGDAVIRWWPENKPIDETVTTPVHRYTRILHDGVWTAIQFDDADLGRVKVYLDRVIAMNDAGVIGNVPTSGPVDPFDGLV